MLLHALRNCELSSKSKSLLNYLWIFKDGCGCTTSSYSEIQSLAGCTNRNTLKRAKQELIDAGIIKVEKRHSKQTGNRLRNKYRLIPFEVPKQDPWYDYNVKARIRNRVLDRDQGTCQYCRTQKGDMHIDHIIPHSKGGPTTETNLQIACSECNRMKGDSLFVNIGQARPVSE